MVLGTAALRMMCRRSLGLLSLEAGVQIHVAAKVIVVLNPTNPPENAHKGIMPSLVAGFAAQLKCTQHGQQTKGCESHWGAAKLWNSVLSL